MKHFFGTLFAAIGWLWILFFGLMMLFTVVGSRSEQSTSTVMLISLGIFTLPGFWFLVCGYRWRRASMSAIPSIPTIEMTATIGVVRRPKRADELRVRWPHVDVTRVFEICNRRRGLFKPSATAWIIPLIATDQGEMAVRTSGNALDADRKRALALSTRAKFGSAYIDSLTEAGLAVAQDAASLYVNEIMHVLSRAECLADCRAQGICKVRLCAAQDDRTCKAALVANDRVYPVSDAPTMPLPTCDAPFCRCIWLPEV